jgi:Polysaccharide deacetylase
VTYFKYKHSLHITINKENTLVRIKTIFSRIVLITGCGICFAAAGTVDQPLEVGTWANFCKGAVSHTFDDNTGNQLSVAVPLFNKFGFHMTIFSDPAFLPDYSGLKKAFAKGHEIGSHGLTHTDGEANFEASQKVVQDSIPGEKCVSYAYPFCNSPKDKSQTATKTYIAARNCNGYPNAATPENWDEIKSQIISPKFSYSISGVDKLNGMADAAINQNGWSVYLHHGIDGDHDYSTSSGDLKGNLDYLNKKRELVWCETFGNVARYIKERDAVTVKNKASDNQTMTISITDTLDDQIFNYPLSIRLPVEDTWKKPSVKQAGKKISHTIVVVDGKKYLMFNAVPDGGDVVINTGVTTKN